MSFSPNIPNEIWSRIISFVPPPRRNRDFEADSFLPELIDPPALDPENDTETRPLSSMMLVSRKIRVSS